MLSVPSSSRLEAGPWPPRRRCAGLLTALSCASVALPTATLAHSRACPLVFAALPAARHTNHHAGDADPRALRGMSMTSCSSWLPGRMVIRALAPCAAHRTPPVDHAVKLTSHVPGRDHVTGPDQVRAHTGRPSGPPRRNLYECPARFPLVMIRTSAMKGPGPAGLGSRRTRGRALPSRVFPNLCRRRDEAPRATSPAFSVLMPATDESPAWACRPGLVAGLAGSRRWTLSESRGAACHLMPSLC